LHSLKNKELAILDLHDPAVGVGRASSLHDGLSLALAGAAEYDVSVLKRIGIFLRCHEQAGEKETHPGKETGKYHVTSMRQLSVNSRHLLVMQLFPLDHFLHRRCGGNFPHREQ